jgi:P27 family predicted phage terminase small subunit
MVGRKPKPTKLKLITGHGHHPLNKNEPEAPEGELHCPTHLSTEAKKEWHRIVPILYQMKVARIPDQAAIAAYCQTYGRWVDAENKMAKLGDNALLMKTSNGNILQSPLVGIANRAMEIMLKFMTEFGLTPSSRSRIVSDKPKEGGEMDNFTARRKNIAQSG